MVKVIHVTSWKEASQKTGTYVIDERTPKDAVERMKKTFPNVIPEVCYWHEMGGGVNRYYFVKEKE